MSEDRKTVEDRRRFLKIVGGSAVLVPIIGLAGCSGGKQEAPAAAKTDMAKARDAAAESKAAMEAKMESPAAADKSGSMPRLAEDDPQAKSLSYVHDSASVDSAKQPRHQAGQACDNCALFQGKGGEEWAGCSIFPGKLVKASGWCSVYAAKPA